MKNLPGELVLQKNVWSDKNPWVVLVQIDLLDDDSTILRYAANTQDFEYPRDSGIMWTAIGIRPSSMENAQQGALSEVSIVITNVGRVLIDYLMDPDDVIGSAVKLIFVNAGLTEVDHSSLEVNYTIQNFKVDSQDVEFSLGDETLVIQRHPPRLYSTLQCEWAPHNFKGAECQYVGTDTTCNGLLDSCRNRTGGSNTEHFGGNPTLHNDGLKVAIANG